MIKESKFGKFICILLMMIMVLSVFTQAVPVFALTEDPLLDAEIASVTDCKTGAVVFSKEGDVQKNPGAATKLMTAVVAADKGALTDTAKSQIKSMLLENNDKSAEQLATDTYGSSENFIKAMNEKAAAIKCSKTKFASVTGSTDSKEHYTTAKDMGLIIKAFMSNDELSKLLTLGEAEKDKIKYCEILKSDDKASTFVSVILGVKDDSEFISFALGGATAAGNLEDGKTILQFGLKNYRTYHALSKGKSAGKIKIKGGQKSYIKVYAKDDLYITLPAEGEDSLVKTEIVLEENVQAPIEKNTVVGKVQALEAGEVTAETEVIVKEAVSKGGPWSKIGISDYMMITMGIIFLVLLIVFIIIRTKIKKKKKRIAEIRRQKREAEAMKIAMERAEKRRRNWPY